MSGADPHLLRAPLMYSHSTASHLLPTHRLHYRASFGPRAEKAATIPDWAPGKKGGAASAATSLFQACSSTPFSFFCHFPVSCLWDCSFFCLWFLVTVSHPFLYFFSFIEALSAPPLPSLWLSTSLCISPRVPRPLPTPCPGGSFQPNQTQQEGQSRR